MNSPIDLDSKINDYLLDEFAVVCENSKYSGISITSISENSGIIQLF